MNTLDSGETSVQKPIDKRYLKDLLNIGLEKNLENQVVLSDGDLVSSEFKVKVNGDSLALYPKFEDDGQRIDVLSTLTKAGKESGAGEIVVITTDLEERDKLKERHGFEEDSESGNLVRKIESF